MCMYLGQYQTKFTGKGRVILPKSVRKLAGNRIVLKKGLDGCVEGYSLSDWEKQNQNRFELTQDRQDRFKNRFYLASMELVELDSQGRFVIPPDMRKFSSIGDRVVIIGAGNHFEIWDFGIWKAHIKEIEGAYDR